MLRVKHPGYLAVSVVLVGAGGLFWASQLIPAALASMGTGLLVGAKKGVVFGRLQGAKPTAAKKVSKKSAKANKHGKA